MAGREPGEREQVFAGGVHHRLDLGVGAAEHRGDGLELLGDVAGVGLGEDGGDGVIATARHFLGYGATEAGQNMAVTQLCRRELYEVYARPFEATIALAGLGSVMNSYSAYDGVPVGASRELLMRADHAGDLLPSAPAHVHSAQEDQSRPRHAGPTRPRAVGPSSAAVRAMPNGPSTRSHQLATETEPAAGPASGPRVRRRAHRPCGP